MGIEDIQISEELETNAPSIKYRGDEGPRSPQEEQQMMIASLEEEYSKYVFEMEEQGLEPMSMQRFIQQAMAEGQMSGGQPLPQDPTKPVNPFGPKPTGPVLPNRQMAAFGGIMGLDGRRQYGIGSSFKKFVRKVIPNEVAAIAEKAAPIVAMVAPQFALPAAIAGGLGRFDRTGRIGSSLASGLKTYSLGQLSDASGLAPFKNVGPAEGMFSRAGAMGGKYNVKDILGRRIAAAGDAGRITAQDLGVQVGDNAGFTKTANEGILKSLEGTPDYFPNLGGEIAKKQSTNLFGKAFTELPGLVKKNLQAAGLGNNLMTGLLVGGLGVGALMGNMTEEEQAEMDRGEGMDVEGIRQEVLTAMKDPTGEALKAIRVKYPFLGRRDTKDLSGLAMGGRAGFAEGGGIMDLGGMEKDYRAEGGFVPIGREEKADDVPARLSVNEFVFTADAVRNAGGGDIDQGAQVMENMMKHLEQGGQVSEESQGMQGARDMFATSERLSEVI